MPGLLDPIEFAGLHLENRIVMPPMASGRAGPDGGATDDHVEYHRLRAAAGTALIIVEHSYVLPIGRFNEGQLGVHQDGMVPGLGKIAAAIRAEGSVACLQLAHAGATGSPAIAGTRPVAPSAVATPMARARCPTNCRATTSPKP
jgi:2,4-dienoyl-CoA reductase-like NADH-dependent reductase (Old Yellow Enzyme family)